MTDKEEYIWKDLILEISHHYKTDNIAKSTLKKYINGTGRYDVIKGYRFEKKDKNIYIIKD